MQSVEKCIYLFSIDSSFLCLSFDIQKNWGIPRIYTARFRTSEVTFFIRKKRHLWCPQLRPSLSLLPHASCFLTFLTTCLHHFITNRNCHKAHRERLAFLILCDKTTIKHGSQCSSWIVIVVVILFCRPPFKILFF